jgi:actin-related protein
MLAPSIINGTNTINYQKEDFGLQEAVLQTWLKADRREIQKEVVQNVIVTGGCTTCTNFIPRFQKEIQSLINNSSRIISPSITSQLIS